MKVVQIYYKNYQSIKIHSFKLDNNTEVGKILFRKLGSRIRKQLSDQEVGGVARTLTKNIY